MTTVGVGPYSDARVEAYYDGGWVDVTDDVDMRREISISYGQPDEHGEAEPSDVQVTMVNRPPKYAPLDPNSELFGKIGIGTPLRVRIGDPQESATLALPGLPGSYASTPDVSALDITGDIDIRVDADPSNWSPPGLSVLVLASKYEVASDQRSWALYVLAGGYLRFAWSPDGTIASRITVDATDPIPPGSRRLAVRVTLDVNNGASGRTTTFYTAPTLGGTYTQLGSGITTAGTTSIKSGTAPVEVGSADGGTDPFNNEDPIAARVYAFQLRSSIGGTVVANPDFTAQTANTTSFVDSAGRTWNLNGKAQILVEDPSVRGTVAATAYQPTWDETTLDAQMTIRGAGILERLGHGREPLRSSLVRDLKVAATTVAYWPCEDGANATSVAAAVGGLPLSVSGTVTMAGYDGFAGSQATPTFDVGHFTGKMPKYTPAARQRIASMLHLPEGGLAADRNLLRVTCAGGSIGTMTLVAKADGALRIAMTDSSGASVLDTSSGMSLNGANAIVWILVTQVGANISWQFGKVAEGEVAVSFADGTLNSHTYSRFTSMTAGSAASLADTSIAHINVINGDDSDGFWNTILNSMIAWDGERAGHRLARLNGEESVPFLLQGAALDTELIGRQTSAQLLDLLDDAAAADLGRFGERRDAYALLYRTRADLYNQTPALELDMDDGHIINPFDPPHDTQAVQNDVTVSREGGSSYRAVLESGPMSVADPPDGIGGSFPATPTLNLHSDGQLQDQASWRLHLGTVNEHRIAQLEIDMEHHPDLVQAVLEVRNGDLIRITNPPPGLPPGPLDLMVLGAGDVITDVTWHVKFNCAPGSPWTVGDVSDGADEQRVDTDGSEVATNFAAGTGTSLSVAITAGPLWTRDVAEFPFEINAGGVVLNVTAISGSSSPQTFTVDATPVNGVVKTIPAGSDVRLAHPMIIGL